MLLKRTYSRNPAIFPVTHNYELQVLLNQLYRTDPINVIPTSRISPHVHGIVDDRQTGRPELWWYLHIVQHWLQMHSLYIHLITVIIV